MKFCIQCGQKVLAGAKFCGGCGAALSTLTAQPDTDPNAPTQALRVAAQAPEPPPTSTKAVQTELRSAQSPEVVTRGPQTSFDDFQAASHSNSGFFQKFGIDVRAALLAIAVDFLVFSGSVASLGMLLPVAFGAACILTFITYKIQRSWYGDDPDSAIIKAAILGLLTAIPVPIASIVAGPGGIIGLMHMLRRKK